MIVVQFSMSFLWSLPVFSFVSCSPSAYLLYHIRCRLSRGFAKLFSSFFEEVLVSNFFAEALQPFTDLRFFATALLSAACILYHIGLRLSRGFRKLFEVFSKPFGFDRPCQTTWLLYHIVRLLSTPFDKVFEIFLKKPMGTATKSISYAECRAGWPTLGILIALGWRHPAVERISMYGMGVGIHHPTVE